MPAHQIGSDHFHLHAYLPFIELAHESMIQVGPIAFWPASKSEEFFPNNTHLHLQNYLQKIGQVKAHCHDEQNSIVNTITLSLKGTTCVSISEKVPKEMREFLLIDALYLLYFASSFRNLYYGQEILPFNSFRKMVPASDEFVNEKKNWENLSLKEIDREETVCLHIIDEGICEGLGKALEAIYLSLENQDPELMQTYKRLVRSIRYLVDRFFSRFINLFDKGLYFSEEIFEPEDVIFLATSFETLFKMDNVKEAASDFKHKLRPLLHLKYTRPVEIFWKWVDDFYEVKRRLLNGDTFLDPLFRINPNFEVSHILLGIKLFVYSVYYHLFKYKLLDPTYVDSYSPPDFKWIHPEEVLLFFWTESSVLETISLFVRQSEQGKLKEEHLSDLHLLTTLFVSLYDRYFMSNQKPGEGVLRFLPSPVAELKKDGNFILENLKKMDSNHEFIQHIHPYFSNVLDDRLQEKRIVA